MNSMWRTLLALNLILLVLLAFSWPFIDDPGTRAVATLSFGIIVTSLVGLGVVIYFLDIDPFQQ